MTPEEKAKIKIEELLKSAGWAVADRSSFDRNSSEGAACREFIMPDNSEADYALFASGKPAGVIEAKKSGISLSGIENQSKDYLRQFNSFYGQTQSSFIYETNGEEIFFTDIRDSNTPSRRIFAFHTPQELAEKLNQTETLRQKLKQMPLLDAGNLRKCQYDAIKGLEYSLSRGLPRSLIQMATGAGKTYTACNFSYRLIKHAKAKRILFLVDRNNLGRQTLREFQNFRPQDSDKLFTENYITQHLQHNKIDRDAKVVITTIQRLYSMLRGEKDYDENEEEFSSYELNADKEIQPKEITYNPDLPIDYFDFIITDECHRSIYGLWRQVLEYFDAFIIGLTATPSAHTLGYFNKNIVAEYPYERSVADQVNVGYDIFSINTEVSQKGGKIKAGFTVPARDKRTRHVKYEQLQDDFNYTPQQLDRSVVVPNQIRAVLECYRDNLFKALFPDREPSWVPKTLIFAKDDNHAEDITRIAREVFFQGNNFCKKITYNVSGAKPEDLIKEFRATPFPRIAVTVDMIATGTDIKPLEVIIFMRDVHSELYFEQMKGRGVRSINNADLKQITPNSDGKTKFILIDAVGVTESKKNTFQPLERKKSVPFEKLVEQAGLGKKDDETLSSLAGRLSALSLKLDDETKEKIKDLSGGKDLAQISNGLLDAIDPDKLSNLTEKKIDEIKENAIKPFSSPKFRNILSTAQKRTSKIYIDEITTDSATIALSKDWAENKIKYFEVFIQDNKDKIDALSIIYEQSYSKRHLTYNLITHLRDALIESDPPMSVPEIWRAYAILKQGKVKGIKDPERILTNIVQLVKFALKYDDYLDSFDSVAEQRFNLWLGRQKQKGTTFSEEQLSWLKQIKDFITANGCMEVSDIQETLSDKGGIIRAQSVFQSKQNLENILNDLSVSLLK